MHYYANVSADDLQSYENRSIDLTVGSAVDNLIRFYNNGSVFHATHD